MLRWFFVCFAALSMLNCALGRPPDQTSDALLPVAFLAGCWKAAQKTAVVFEQWSPPMRNTMMGASLTLDEGGAEFYEFMRMHASSPQSVVFYAQPKGRSPATEFRLVHSKPNSVIFENRAHDFPQKIEYERNGDQLTARISAITGDIPAQTWVYQRIPCE